MTLKYATWGRHQSSSRSHQFLTASSWACCISMISSWDGYNSIHSMVALGVVEYVTSAPRAIRENKMKKKTHVLLPQHDITKSVLLCFATDYTHSDVYSKDVTTSSSRQTVSSLPAHAVRDNVITTHHTSHCALPCCLASWHQQQGQTSSLAFPPKCWLSYGLFVFLSPSLPSPLPPNCHSGTA